MTVKEDSTEPAQIATARRCAQIAEEECRRLNEKGMEYNREHRYERADDAARMADQCAKVASLIRKEFGIT